MGRFHRAASVPVHLLQRLDPYLLELQECTRRGPGKSDKTMDSRPFLSVFTVRDEFNGAFALRSLARHQHLASDDGDAERAG